MQLDKGRLIVIGVAAVSIAVWLIVFPLVLIRGPAGAYSGEDGGVFCIEGGEAHADHDLVRFMRRFHYLGVRAEVKTGAAEELCFVLTLARRIPEATEAVLRPAALSIHRVMEDQSPLYPSPEQVRRAGMQESPSAQLGPKWVATSTGPVARLIDAAGDLPGPAFPYCRAGLCTAVMLETEPVATDRDVMAAFPIRTDAQDPALLLRLAPPPLQRITSLAGDTSVPLAFVVDGHVISMEVVSPPKADGQLTITLDRKAPDIEFEAAALAAILSSGALEGNWRAVELRMSPKSEM